MDRFRNLVSKLGIGDARSPSPRRSPTPDRNARTDEILKQLPLTTKFSESLPRHVVIQKASENERKAVEATKLVQRVDDFVKDHVNAAHDLRKYVEGLADIKVQLSVASAQAYSIHQQLLEVDRTVNSVESISMKEDLNQTQQAEDAAFEIYAKEKRLGLRRKKQEYADKLIEFQKDRFSMSKNLDVEEVSRPALMVPTRASSRTSISKESLRGKGKSIETDEQKATTSVSNSELDDFFGTEEPREIITKVADIPKPKKKSTKVSSTGVSIKPKAAPARPRMNIMADEDFLE